MDWLQDLETRRDLAAQRVIDDPHEQNLADLTQKIVATIAGKYGISSTPATPQEREKILRSIDKNRQLSPTMPNMMAEYLGYEEDSTLSEDQLRRIAQEKGIDFQVFQSHLAAIAVADGASFSLKVPGAGPLTVEDATKNILFTHDEDYKEGLNRLLGTLPDAEKETLIQTLTRVAKTKTGPPLESDGFQKALADPIKTEIQKAFMILLDGDNRGKQLFLKICGRLGLGNADLCLDVISAKKAGGPEGILSTWEKLAALPAVAPADWWLKAVAFKSLEDEASEIQALEKIIAHPDAFVLDLYSAAEGLERLGKPDLAIQAWEKIIAHPDASGDLYFAANEAIKRLKLAHVNP